MKKEYKKPLAEIIKFEAEDVVMSDLGLGDDDDDIVINPGVSIPDEW